jgi:hypothetical protein
MAGMETPDRLRRAVLSDPLLRHRRVNRTKNVLKRYFRKTFHITNSRWLTGILSHEIIFGFLPLRVGAESISKEKST